MRTRRGTTLIEVMVASAVLLMLMGSLYLLMTAGLRYFMQGRAYQTVQQQSLIGLRAMLAELQDSRRTDLEFSSVPVPHVRFLSPSPPYPNGNGPVQSDPSSGKILWQKWVCYRVFNNELQRDEQIGAGLPSVTAPAAIPGYGTFDFTGPEFKVVARNVTELNLADASPDSIFVELVASENTGSARRTEQRLRSQVFLYNRF